MKSGYFRHQDSTQRPFVDLILEFPIADNQSLEISFLVDTGADHTLLSPLVGVRLRQRLGIDLLGLPFGTPIGGIGGEVQTRMIDATLDIGEQSISTTLSLVEPPPGQFPTMPSLLGRDIIYQLALFMEYRTDRLLLLDESETQHTSFNTGVTAMTTTPTKLLTADDLLQLYGKGVRGELIRGELCETMPSGGRHGEVVMKVGFFLTSFILPRRLGRLAGSDSGVLLERDPDTVREPDIAFISAERLPLDVEVTGYYEVVPDLVVEVVSPSDSAREVMDKALMWLGYGARMVWAVNPETRSVDVYRPGERTITLTESDTLDGLDILPGFTCPIADIFAF